MRKIPKIKRVTFKVGDKIRVVNITDPGEKIQDRDLNGRTGVLTKRFVNNPHGYIGAILDPVKGSNFSEKINLARGEFEHLTNESK